MHLEMRCPEESLHRFVEQVSPVQFKALRNSVTTIRFVRHVGGLLARTGRERVGLTEDDRGHSH